MLDRYNREINYLRISVTDRCNLHCVYCRPEKGIKLIPRSRILSFEQIEAVVHAAVKLGIRKIKLTGGEPLVRRGIVLLVSRLSHIPGLEDLSMTTNGTLLAEYAADLAGAGLQRVNISLDTLDPDEFRQITRGGNLDSVLQGIAAARAAGLVPIKLNCVVENSAIEKAARSVEAYARDQQLTIQFIRRMELSTGTFYIVGKGRGGDCVCCSRLRLTSSGIIKPCLFNDLGYSIWEYGIEQSLKSAIMNKPAAGQCSREHKLYNIGG